MKRSEAEARNERAIDELLDYVKNIGKDLDRRLTKVARTSREPPALPDHQKPARAGASPAARIIPTRRPSSLGEDVPSDPRPPIQKMKQTIAAAALALNQRFGRPVDDMRAMVQRLVDVSMDKDGLDFQEALTAAVREAIDGIQRGMR